MDQVKTIQVKDETKRKLAKLGSKGETYDDIIRKLIHSHAKLARLATDRRTRLSLP